jgi:hypothetical protein
MCRGCDRRRVREAVKRTLTFERVLRALTLLPSGCGATMPGDVAAYRNSAFELGGAKSPRAGFLSPLVVSWCSAIAVNFCSAGWPVRQIATWAAVNCPFLFDLLETIPRDSPRSPGANKASLGRRTPANGSNADRYVRICL